MAPAKRKAGEPEPDPAPAAKRGRPRKAVEKTAASSARPDRASLIAANQPRSLRSRSSASVAGSPNKSAASSPAKKKAAVKVKAKLGKRGRKAAELVKEPTAEDGRQSNLSVDLSAKPQNGLLSADEEEEDTEGPSYWLMKAEPESRIEKGKDVKFSIDDLKAATTPEPWDGVRNLAARNNMRAMMKGDQAFFYHSNCKVPGIVGTMEVVQEHSVDESAFDKEHPYFDEKSTRDKPKWFVVHVEFRNQFPEMVKLKDLQKYSKDGGVLQNMQVLKQSRLSVSKVSKKEWDFIMSLVNNEQQAET